MDQVRTLPEVERTLAEARAALNDGHPQRARALFSSALQSDETPRARFEWALFLTQTGDHSAALTEWRRLWEAAAGTEFHRIAFAAAQNLASLHRRRGEWALARAWHQRVLSEVARHPADTCSVELLIDCASDSLSQRRFRSAKTFLEAAVRVAKGAQNEAALADARGSLGVLHLMRGRTTDALRCFQQSIPGHWSVGDDEGLAIDALNLANLAITRGRPRAALSAARLALRHAARAGISTLVRSADDMLVVLTRALGRLARDPRCN